MAFNWAIAIILAITVAGNAAKSITKEPWNEMNQQREFLDYLAAMNSYHLTKEDIARGVVPSIDKQLKVINDQISGERPVPGFEKYFRGKN